MSFDVFKILEEEGYFKDGRGNLIHAEKAFFAARVMKWIREQVQTNPEFDLPSYLTMLVYYKNGMAELKFSDKDGKLLYKMNHPDQEVQEIVDSLLKNDKKRAGDAKATEEPTSTEDADGTPDP